LQRRGSAVDVLLLEKDLGTLGVCGRQAGTTDGF
jgi:hypothetical protein